MITLDEKIITEKEGDYPYITKHFAERYFERVLTKPVPKRFNKGIYNGIRKDMDKRMLDREKMALKLFAKSSIVVVPIAKFKKMVVKKNTLITVY